MLNDDIPAAAYHGQKGYEIGYAAGLDAAREAIDGLMPSEFWEGIPTRTAQWWVVKAEALAAIDALREKQ